MPECDWVWVGNLRPNTAQEDMEHFLQEVLGYDDFVVRMGNFDFPTPHAFCYVLFEDHVVANDLRHRFLRVSAQICKCMPHLYF